MNHRALLALLALMEMRRAIIQRILATIPFAPGELPELIDILIAARDAGIAVALPEAAQLARTLEQADRVLEQARRHELQLLAWNDAWFPPQLRAIPDPPVLLFCRGAIEIATASRLVALVGTREPSPFGHAAARRLGQRLAERGIVVVNGLAIGCDSETLHGCVAHGGQAVVVLPGGLDRVYPATNTRLAEEILDAGGCWISEYAPGTRATKASFVARDRLQSGLAAGVLVVEAGIGSGTMHTARFALQQGRLLGCLAHPPGYSDAPSAAGNQLLIAEGAAMPIPAAATILPRSSTGSSAVLRQRQQNE
jgi:DNA processing protein